MKKCLLITLAIIMCIALVSCGSVADIPQDSTTQSPLKSSEPTLEPTPTPEPKTLQEYHSPEAICERGRLVVSFLESKQQAVFFRVPEEPEVYGERAGQLAGAIPFMCEQLAEDMGVEIEYIDYPTLEETILASQNGDVDISVGNWAITPERLSLYSMTDDFTTWKSGIGKVYFYISPENPGVPVIETKEQLGQAKIAAVAGSVRAEYVAKHYPEAELLLYPEGNAVLQALISGEADAAFIANNAECDGELLQQAYDEGKIYVGDSIDDDRGTGFILMKGNNSLTQYVNERIASYLESGQIESWYDEGKSLFQSMG